MKIAIPTMSLGRPGLHSLDDKLHQAAQHGFEGIELFIDDLDHLATTRFNGSPILAAHHIHALCTSLNLTVLCLQPFSFYEGLLDRSQTAHLLTTKLPLWFDLARILHTDLIQIPANFLPPDPTTGLPRTSPDIDLIVSDLQTIADLGITHSPIPTPIRFVYEALAWSSHIDTWESASEIVRRVNRPNFGLCLDSFNLAGRIYADPSSPTGKTPNAESDLEASLSRLQAAVNSGTLDPKKIFYIQLVDGERLSAPLDENHPFHVPGQPVRMSWSRNARLFPCEEERGGYLPVLRIARVFFDIGFEGWVSLELFSRDCAEDDPATPAVLARRGMVSWGKVVERLGLDVRVPLTSSAVSAAAGRALTVEAEGAVLHRL